jgi:endonuclease/exonuclease/phosphatase family metal-dependent hydrolase
METRLDLNGSVLNLVTLNCFGVPFVHDTRARLATIARELDQAAVDVVCLQEIQFAPYVPFLDRGFSQFPYTAFEPFLYAPKGGLLTFSRQPIAASTFAPYPQRGWWHTPSAADRLLYKGILSTRLVYAGQEIIILNTHLTANYDGDWSPRNRYAQLERAQLDRLAQLVNRLPSGSIIVVAGDFNIPRHSWLYDGFVAATGMIDPLAGNREPTYHPVFNLPRRFHQPIDFVFVRPPRGSSVTASAEFLFENEVELASGRFGRVSDHTGIKLELWWQDAPIEAA